MPSREIFDELVAALRPLRFGPPVTHVYNPLEYAREPFDRYLERYGSGPREIVLLGMNPGPFGMAQTGVPFGEVAMVRGWLEIDGAIGRPAVENPKRPIRGFDCHRSEVSGSRVWGWARDTYGTPERFFRRFFVYNYCPLVFMEESGRNVTPDKLPAVERAPLFEACDAALRRVVTEMKPRFLVGIGGFAEGRAREALQGFPVEVGRILHPSPANPRANRGWALAVKEDMKSMGISLP
ncbi:MAG TPA: uracil-DNA glycosylase family protein [Vulgatibacter sp.]